MKPLKSKRKRITLNDAQKFIKNGIGSGMEYSDYINNEERIKIIENVIEDLVNIIPNNFPHTRNLEYAILKTHLIIEYALTQFIRCSSYVLMDIDSIRFNFLQKLEISILLGLGNGDPVLIPTLKLINQLRNQVAHNFNFKINTLDKMIKLNSESHLIELNDRNRIKYLKSICASICGRIIGRIENQIL
jgi:hypothetical protein